MRQGSSLRLVERTPIRSGTKAALFTAKLPPVVLLRGRAAIVAAAPLLAALAERSRQRGEADNLAFFLSGPHSRRKSPCLLLIGSDGAASLPGADPDGLLGAVLLHEYVVGSGRTRVYATADSTGRRSVLAPLEQRARVAAIAARTLVARGAHMAHVAFSATHTDEDGVPASPPHVAGPALALQAVARELSLLPAAHHAFRWTLERRKMRTYLPLAGSFDATLARIGQRTRSNLRYYRRRAEHELGSRFVPEARLTLAAFLAFNRRCTYPVTEKLAAYRFACTAAGSFLAGVQDRDGEWLALVGGRRQHRFAEIDWQMNRHDLPLLSLSTVARAYLM